MKRKGKLFINIALIALSLCIMVAGVYAAKTASLGVTGTISFAAHGVDIKLTGVTVTGSNTTATIDNTTLDNISGKTVTITNLNFKDDGTSATGYKPSTNIVIKFSFKNTSKFAVTCSATAPTDTSFIQYTSAITTTSLVAETGTTDVTLTLKCLAIESFDSNQSFTFPISFTK